MACQNGSFYVNLFKVVKSRGLESGLTLQTKK